MSGSGNRSKHRWNKKCAGTTGKSTYGLGLECSNATAARPVPGRRTRIRVKVFFELTAPDLYRTGLSCAQAAKSRQNSRRV
jgi:hypothetical protein